MTIEVDAPGWAALGVKEQLAMYLERYGDARVIDVQERIKTSYDVPGARPANRAGSRP